VESLAVSSICRLIQNLYEGELLLTLKMISINYDLFLQSVFLFFGDLLVCFQYSLVEGTIIRQASRLDF